MSILKTTESKVYESFDDMPLFNSKAGMKLLQGIIDYKFVKPSVIQQLAIMPLSQGRDVIAKHNQVVVRLLHLLLVH